MTFKSREELGGQVDPNINTKGRMDKKSGEKLTNRQIREKELLGLLRKLKPLVADSINTAAKIMKNDGAKDADRLKATMILLQNYKELVGDLYDKDYDDDENEAPQQENVPVFSLKVVNNGSE